MFFLILIKLLVDFSQATNNKLMTTASPKTSNQQLSPFFMGSTSYSSSFRSMRQFLINRHFCLFNKLLVAIRSYLCKMSIIIQFNEIKFHNYLATCIATLLWLAIELSSSAIRSLTREREKKRKLGESSTRSKTGVDGNTNWKLK